MTPAEALTDIRGYAAANRIRLTGHASLRMQQRGADLRDVRSALMTATTCTAQENGTWRVTGGVDRDRDELNVIAALEQGVVVITFILEGAGNELQHVSQGTDEGEPSGDPA